jgi:hypothetical protein
MASSSFSLIETVNRAMKSRDIEVLEKVYGELKRDLAVKNFLKDGELCNLIGPGCNQLNRNFSAEIYLPSSVVESDMYCLAVR